jgi:hypothetical protein
LRVAYFAKILASGTYFKNFNIEKEKNVAK